MLWLLNQAEFEQLSRLALSDAVVQASVSWNEREEVEARPRGYVIAGNVARVEVSGILTPRPSLLSWLMGGGTTYKQISDALAAAMADSSVKSIELVIDSPGGAVDGLFELFDLIREARDLKGPINVIASRAQSAAYGIAAVAGGKITPSSVGAMFGSVGVRVEYLTSDDIVNISSTDAPNKAPDVSTEEGQAVVRAELDQIHQLFVEAIAEGRSYGRKDEKKVTAQAVNENYGRGGSMVAALAYEAGLIDARPRSTQPRRGKLAADQAKDKKMKFSEFAAQFPEEAAAALEGARAAERKRCSTHYGLAAKSGNYQFAAECVANGTEAGDPIVLFEHMESSKKAPLVEERQKASDATEEAVSGVASESKGFDMGDAVAAALYGESI